MGQSANITLTCLLFTNSVFAQNPPVITWERTFGGSNKDFCSGIRQTPDGGYVVAGSTQSNDGDVTGYHGMADMWVVKINELGDLEWQKALGGSETDSGLAIDATDDGGSIVAGSTASYNGDVSRDHGLMDIWVVKLNTSGAIAWQKALGGSQYELA